MPTAPATHSRLDLIKWVADHRFTHAITLNPNRNELSIANLRRMFGQFCLEVDRIKLGKRRVDRVPTWARFKAIAFAEHLETNAHLHAACNFDRGHWSGRQMDEELENRLKAAWDLITKGSGQLDIQPINNAGWAHYITKELYRAPRDYFLAADFHPNDRVVDYRLDRVLEALAREA